MSLNHVNYRIKCDSKDRLTIKFLSKKILEFFTYLFAYVGKMVDVLIQFSLVVD